MRNSFYQRAILSALALILGLYSDAAVCSELLVSNVDISQRPFSAIVDVTYDLQTVDGQPVAIFLFFSTDGGDSYPYQCSSVSGDVGSGVIPGTSRHIVWNAAEDFPYPPGLIDTNCRLRVLADDSNVISDFIYLPPGTFTMGSPPYEIGHQDDETEHEVVLNQGYFISRYEISEALWDSVMGNGASISQLPRSGISWDMAVMFCNELSLLEGLTPAYTIHSDNGHVTWDRHADGYRLPTEAEWEYACRAASNVAFTNGPISHPGCSPLDQNLDQVGWYCGNASAELQDVGSKLASNWGLHDMHGNVSEWIWDGYRADYENLPHINPAHDVYGEAPRLIRGGNYDSQATNCRSASRVYQAPSSESGYTGFRLARTPINMLVGTITIVPVPSHLDASWAIEGPGELSTFGIGQAVLAYMPAGEYTVTWGEVTGWNSPANQTLSLEPSSNVQFLGEYAVQPPPEGFVYIPPGSFMMGSPDDEPGRFSNEGPQHQVTLTQGFYMSRYEVTEEWWHQVIGGTPTSSQLPKTANWDMAVHFCNALSISEGLTPAYTISGPNGNVTWNQGANGYRLPTEAEWEYACRAGATMAYHNDTNCLCSDSEANFDGRVSSQLPGCPSGVFRDALTEVGIFPSNQWGLYDMHGNLWEWVWDGMRSYSNGTQIDPVTNAEPGADRVRRSGNWNNIAARCRSALRNSSHPSVDHANGFRPVRTTFDPQLGMISIEPQPTGIDAPWELSGPNGFFPTGVGATTFTNMAPGDYTITWGDVPGRITPESETLALEPGGAVTFTGNFEIITVMLFEGFSNVSCVGCPAMLNNIHYLMHDAGYGFDRLLFIKYAGSNPNGADPMFLSNISMVRNRSQYYTGMQTFALPTLVVQGALVGSLGTPPEIAELQQLVDTGHVVPAAFYLTVTSPHLADFAIRDVDCEIVLHAPDNGVDLSGHQLRAVLLYSEVHTAVEYNPGGDEYYWVARRDAEVVGDVGAIAPGTNTLFNVTLNDPDPSLLNLTPLGREVIVFIQNNSTKAVIQAGSSMMSASDPIPRPRQINHGVNR